MFDPRGYRLGILLWAVIAGVVCGVSEFGAPLENTLQYLRNLSRMQPASGEIVLVGIDDRSVAQPEEWPWPRRRQAELLEKLQEFEPRTITFSMDLSARSNPVDDKRFEDALARSQAEVTLATRFLVDSVTGTRSEFPPIVAFERHAKLANVNVWTNALGEVLQLPYSLDVAGRSHLSISAALAGKPIEPGQMFAIDYSIDLRTIPVVSAIDVLHGKVDRRRLADKKLVVAVTSRGLAENHRVVGIGQVPAAYIHVLGAETLGKGVARDLGWLPMLCLAFVLVLPIVRLLRQRMAYSAAAAVFALLLVGPLVLDQRSVHVDVVPALLLVTIVVGGRIRADIRRSLRLRGLTNAVSGLPNLNALRQEDAAADSILLAARIYNFAEITSALPHDMERALVEQIVARLELGAPGRTFYQGEEGLFAWLDENEPMASTGDKLEGLHAVFASPVQVADRSIDVAISFGVDPASDRSMTNRIGSALVAADEAAALGLRWRAYDPAKLKDADWKLSLLGRLDAAIDTGEVWVAYQPKLDLASKRIVGAEALVRWTHPEKGEINPEDFVLVAEQHNRIEKLTAHVLDHAVRAAAMVNGRDFDFDISVNLSARLLASPYLLKSIKDVLARHELAAARLTLEVTESAAIMSGSDSISVLDQLRDLGVGISIDDYGTGFSTLEYLRKVPACEIKIDRGFVGSMAKSASDRIMVQSTIELAHSLDRRVVAEGVETSETLRMLEQMGCDQVQGYLVGRPMEFRRLAEILLDQQRRVAA